MALSLYEIFNDIYDAGNHAIQMVLSYVHTHADDANGGQLDWDDVWSDAVHTHQSDAEGGKLDHGATMTGLTDDDHTQYTLRSILTTEGDLPYRDGDNWQRLPIGTNGQYLFSNGTTVSWSDSPAGIVTSKTTVNYDDSSPVTLVTVPAGAIVLFCRVNVTEVFDGTTPALDIGDDGDDDGLLDNGYITETSTGWYPAESTNQGDYLFEYTNHYHPKFYEAETDLKCKITVTEATQGIAVVYITYLDLSMV